MHLGLIVHPTRDLDTVLDEIHQWASGHGVRVGQVPVEGQSREVAEPVEARDCNLLLALGGDGTTLIALHAGAEASRPVMGVACGSVGVLTSVHGDDLADALDHVAEDRWKGEAVPGLDVSWGEDEGGVAINDVAIIRDGLGQVVISITVDGDLYARVAGDGLVAATALGSSGYTMAAGGPILAPGAHGMAVTPLAVHGGSCPAVVAGDGSELILEVDPGYGGVRYEIDGRPTPTSGGRLTIRHRPDYATLVTLAGQESRLAGLRRRGLIADSPRVLVRERRTAR
jgi:NAD+ kinase